MDKDIDTGLKHILKQEFIIYYRNDGKRNYLSSINSTYCNFSENIDSCLKLKTEAAAKGAYMIASEMSRYELHICKTETIVEDIDIDSID